MAKPGNPVPFPMKTRRSSSKAFGIVAAIFAALAAGWFFSLREKKPQNAHLTAPTSSSAGSQPADAKSLAHKQADVEAFLTKIGIGFRRTPPAKQFLKDALANRDKGNIARTFEYLYFSKGWKMEEVIPALKEYLDHPDPFVRYSAAEALFNVGDRSGYAAMLALAQADAPIEGIGQDIRVKAAETLAKYREKDAINTIYELNKKMSGALTSDLIVKLGVDMSAETKGGTFFLSSGSIEHYALDNATQFIPQITTIYNANTRQEFKDAAAWALVSMTGDRGAMDYLLQRANSNPTREVVEYLGAIQRPEAKQALEDIIDRKSGATPIAAVNLIFNQGGSQKASQAVADALTGNDLSFDIDLALNIAANQTNDSIIQAAGQAFAQRNPDSWYLYTVERKNWPIYNWIDNYVIRLNK